MLQNIASHQLQKQKNLVTFKTKQLFSQSSHLIKASALVLSLCRLSGMVAHFASASGEFGGLTLK